MRVALFAALLCGFAAFVGCSGGSSPSGSSSAAPKAPTANAGGPYSSHTDRVVAFNGSGSTDPQSQPLTYAWNFGDGGTGTGVSPSHTYSVAGSYAVSLTVTDTSGVSSLTAMTMATVTNQAPLASTGGPYSGSPGAAVIFNAGASSDPQGSALTYSWNFGDSATGTGVAPTHAYAAAGSYSLSLTVTDAFGLTATALTTVTIVVKAPTADAGGPYSSAIGSPVTFNGAASVDPQGQMLTYAWAFGDGTNGTGVSPSHFYAAAGVFTATLTVTDVKYDLAGTATAPVTSTQVAIRPMTNVILNTSGYFPDPLPIHMAPGSSTATQYFSGSDLKLLSCTGIIEPGCFTTSSITIDDSNFAQQAAAVGSKVTSTGNNNIYQDNAGNWQMATTLHLFNPTQPDTTWSVIAHANPTNTGSPVPTAWMTDAILIGSLATSAKANYDGKYFEDSGNLYLIYSMAIVTTPVLHDGVVAQLLSSATQVASSAPVVLVEPENTANSGNGYNSEYFFGLNPHAPFKLVETGNISVIDGKYVIAYSTGDFQQQWYKAAVAWSDTFLPTSPTGYQKVLMTDTAGVWGAPSETEVEYLLQSQESQWPGFVGAQVLAPGVPSFVNDNGTWYLYFAGFDPSDAPLSGGAYVASHRRPYYVPLQILIPAGATVSGTSPYGLGNWLTPLSQ